MSRPKILIIGAGAVGLSQGFYLSTGADITFLVRPGRSSAFAAPKKLYDYKANALRTFEGYRVVESTLELAGETFFCVLDTLDGYTARSEGGVATLRSVGELIRESKETFVLYDAFGLDIDKHYETTMGISAERIVLVASMLAHQPTPSISVPPSADKQLVNQADLLYSHSRGGVGIMVTNSRPQILKQFEAVYNKNGQVRVQRISAQLLAFGSALAFVQYVTWYIDGFTTFEHFRNNIPLWKLLLKAQQEVLTLPRFGLTGWTLSWIVGSWLTAKMINAPVEDALPLNYQEFSAFHHGGKVVKQDIKILEDLLELGKSTAHQMPALSEICLTANEMQRAKLGTRVQ